MKEFDIEKYKVLHVGSKNIKVEYKLNNMEIKNVNEGMQFRGWLSWYI